MAKQVTYWAISIFSSRMFWWNLGNLIVEALSLTEVFVLIPPKYKPYQLAAVALVNIALRKLTVRPVAFIMPGSTEQVEVPRIGPPPPSNVTD